MSDGAPVPPPSPQSPPPDSASGGLQFDHAVQGGARRSSGSSGPLIICARCKTQVKNYYYHVDHESLCAKCKQEAERASGAARSGGAWMRAGFLGFGAAIVGAAIYYGVIRLFNLEIGIVAILIGYLVGAAVKKGAGGGGRRYQILAASLTYLSVGMAYAPVAYTGFVEARTARLSGARSDSSVAADSAETEGEDSTATAAADSIDGETASLQQASSTIEPKQLSAGEATKVILIGLGLTILFVFILPVMVVIGSLPSGLISAMIIGFGILQAWRMTGGRELKITGPYRVGTPPTPTPAT